MLVKYTCIDQCLFNPFLKISLHQLTKVILLHVPKWSYLSELGCLKWNLALSLDSEFCHLIAANMFIKDVGSYCSYSLLG